MIKSNTNLDNQPDQNPNRPQGQANKPDDRTDEARYQKLPHGFRPFAGRAQRDPLDDDSHLYPSMRRFAEFLETACQNGLAGCSIEA